MGISDNSRKSLIPSFLYSPASTVSSSERDFGLESLVKNNHGFHQSSYVSRTSPPNGGGGGGVTKSFMIPAPNEKIEMFSPAFYAACTAGGMFSCGLTHTAVTPIDVVKCNMQVLNSSF